MMINNNHLVMNVLNSNINNIILKYKYIHQNKKNQRTGIVLHFLIFQMPGSIKDSWILIGATAINLL